jgi:cytidylate kinase
MGDEVASELARRLRWHVFDKEIVDFIARDTRVRQDLVRELDERSQSLIHDMVDRLLRMAEGISFGNEEYHEALLKTLAYFAACGKAVIVGRGSAYVLQGEPGFHLRIIASPERRLQRLIQQWQARPDEARRRMLQIDAERRGFIQHHFRRNVDDLRCYDAIFNTDRLSVDQILRAALGLMGESEPALREEASSRHKIDVQGMGSSRESPQPERH